jgi:hypothetical protein
MRAILPVLTLLILAAGIRFLPLPANFAPLSAMVFVAPLFLQNRWLAMGLPMGLIFLTDAHFGFYPGMSFVYLSYFLISGLGFFQAHLFRSSSSKAFGAFSALVTLLSGAVIFFVFSNLGVWWLGGIYAHTWQGLVDCFVLAIPFFRNTLASHVVFSVGLAGLLRYQYVFANWYSQKRTGTF